MSLSCVCVCARALQMVQLRELAKQLLKVGADIEVSSHAVLASDDKMMPPFYLVTARPGWHMHLLLMRAAGCWFRVSILRCNWKVHAPLTIK